MRRFSSLVSGLVSLLFAGNGLAANCVPSYSQIAVYEHANFEGKCKILSTGSYSNASAFSFENDSISSVIVGPLTRTILYQDSYYGGKRNTLESTSNSSATRYSTMGPNANDSASSIRVLSNANRRAAMYYMGNHPSNREDYWTNEAQGLAHDSSYWYMTQNKDPHLMRFPITANMNTTGPTQRVRIPWLFEVMGCDHYGDPDLYAHPTLGGLIAVPMTGCVAGPMVAIFRAWDLSLVTWDVLYDQTGAAWVAIEPRTKHLFSSGNPIDPNNPIRAYEVNWDAITATGQRQQFLGAVHHVYLRDNIDGEAAQTIEHPQGAVFSPNGFFYIVNGFECEGSQFLRVYMALAYPTSNVFAQQARSSSDYGWFNWEHHCGVFGDEPQGLDYYDMNGKGAPYGGQLHLTMIDNDMYRDALYIKHYDVGP